MPEHITRMPYRLGIPSDPRANLALIAKRTSIALILRAEYSVQKSKI